MTMRTIIVYGTRAALDAAIRGQQRRAVHPSRRYMHVAVVAGSYTLTNASDGSTLVGVWAPPRALDLLQHAGPADVVVEDASFSLEPAQEWDEALFARVGPTPQNLVWEMWAAFLHARVLRK